ncbi:coniferyl-aldehyde dehydrogenase, partial [Sphingobium sp. D43FB]
MSAEPAWKPATQQPLSELLALQRKAFAANPMPTAGQRRQWLNTLRDLLSAEREALIAAISSDFSHRSADETLLAELMPCLMGIDDARKNLQKWMK